ncbi:RDD family protein [Anaerococcus sp. Marseille-Q7828]|uniref:RDD family protein n=1 Tax=Anaerococcus sp. Marseille-Q7828 TaxID=3036300 RepID=UPI0024AE7E7A|nr:RDD family protein [Anaerococcus sp. Marseille-Q7828]
MNEKPSFVYAGFFIRLVAFAIDMVVVYALKRIVTSFVDPNTTIAFNLHVEVLVYWVITLAYFTLTTYFNKGQTLGKMITNIRVVSIDGSDLNFLQIVSRETFGRYVQNKFMFLYLIVGFAPMKQSLMDILSDTVVVRENVSSYFTNKDLEIVTN